MRLSKWKKALRTNWRIVAVLSGALAVVSTGVIGVFAAPPHLPGEEEEEGSNNLSVPAIFVPDATGSPFTGTCTAGDDSQDPTGPMGVDTDGDGVPDEHLDYYVQGVASWQADCDNANAGMISVAAEWGDNLTSAPLKAGTPIRVEIGFLTVPANAMPGYVVVKLDPTLLDRESHYGTLGNEVADFPEVRVWDSGVTLDIRSDDGPVVANDIPYTAEINSTGRIVYGFNWQQPVAGEYTVTVYAPQINITSADAGTVVDIHTVTLDVTVGNKGGGGGNKGGGGRPGDVNPGGGGGGGGGRGPGGPPGQQ